MRQSLSEHRLSACLFLFAAFFAAGSYAQPREFDAKIVKQFDAFDAFQAVAVDEHFFYAINNRQITQHDKADGLALQRWGDEKVVSNSLTHLDSGIVLAGNIVFSPFQLSRLANDELGRGVGCVEHDSYRYP